MEIIEIAAILFDLNTLYFTCLYGGFYLKQGGEGTSSMKVCTNENFN